MRHEAAADFGDDGPVTAAIAASLVGNAQIAGVDEADEVGAFLVERGVSARRIGGGIPDGAIAWLDVSGEFVGAIGAAAMAIDAGELDSGRGVHGLDAD